MEWDERLKASGFRDIEYRDGSLLGQSFTESERAPSQVEYEAVQEYYATAGQWLHARCWSGEGAARRLWQHHAAGESVRDISRATGLPATTVHRRIEALKLQMAEWQRSAGPGRPKVSDKRVEQVKVALTKSELREIRGGAERAGASRVCDYNKWIRSVLLSASRINSTLYSSGAI